jgi:hypothetical protein
VAIQGPARWYLGEEGNLVRLAREVGAEPQADADGAVIDLDLDALEQALSDELGDGGDDS